MRQRLDETVTSFISHWREKILQIIDRPSEGDQITMFVRSLQPRFARHLIGSRHTDFGTLLQALYDIEEGISRGLWVESSLTDPKGKRPLGGPRSDVGAISTYKPRPPRYQQTYQQPHQQPYRQSFQYSFRTRSPYGTSSQYQLWSPVPPQTYLHSALPQPCYAAQAFDRPPGIYARPRVPQAPTVPAPRPQRQFSQLGMSLGHAFRKLVDAGLLTPLAPRPSPQFLSPQFRGDLHCLYHQGPGHDTDRCTTLRHAIQDLINQGLVNLGQLSVTTNPLPAHSTHAVPPPARGIHFIDFDGTDDFIHMMSWDDHALEPIMLVEDSEVDGFVLSTQLPVPFSRIPDAPPFQLSYSHDLVVGHDVPTAFVLMLDDTIGFDDRDVHIVTRSGRVVQPETRPLEGTGFRDDVIREDDEIMRQFQSTQARISIWSLLASSTAHRDALIRSLSRIRVESAISPDGLIHMLTADRATCIVFSADDLPVGGSDHTMPLYITVDCSGHRVPTVLLDNGSALNVCPLATAVVLGFGPSDFGPSTQTIRAYDSTRRGVFSTLTLELRIGPVVFSTLFQVLRIPTSFNLLLGRPWIHRAGAIPSSLHQKVKFIYEGRVISIQSSGDIYSSSEPILEFSHGDNDLFLTGFTFDDVHIVVIEESYGDQVPLPFYRFSGTFVLDMMRGMFYLPGLGLGRRQQGLNEFIATMSHDCHLVWVIHLQRLTTGIWHLYAGRGLGLIYSISLLITQFDHIR